MTLRFAFVSVDVVVCCTSRLLVRLHCIVLNGLAALGVEHLGRVRLMHTWLLPGVTMPMTPSRGLLASTLGWVVVSLRWAFCVLPMGLLR